MIRDNSHSLCVSFSLSLWISSYLGLFLPAEFWVIPIRHIARASWHVAVLQVRQELHGYCKKKITNSLKTILQAALANPDVFQWELTSLAPLKHAPKNGCTYGRCVNLLPSPALADRKVVSHFVTLVIQVACQQVHLSAAAGLSSTAWHTAVQAPVQRPQSWSSHPYPQLEALAWPVPNGMLEQHTQSWLGPNSWPWRNETDSSWASHTCKMILKGALEKNRLIRGRKLSPWSCSATFCCCRHCWQPPSLGGLSKVVELKVYLGRGPNTQGSCSDMAPQCALRQPKGPLDPSASTMVTGTFFHWPLCLVLVIWKYFKTATPQKSSPAAVGFEHEGKWKETGCFTLSHTCRLCRGKALFQEGQTGVLLSVHQAGDLQSW